MYDLERPHYEATECWQDALYNKYVTSCMEGLTGYEPYQSFNAGEYGGFQRLQDLISWCNETKKHCNRIGYCFPE